MSWIESEAHVHEIERRMDLAVDAAGLGIWEWDIPRDDIRTSAKARALLGFTESEAVNLAAFLARVSPADRERVRKTVHASLEKRVEHEMEFRIVPDGGDETVHWMFTRGRVELGTDGNPILMRGVVLDVTQRHRMQSEALQQRNELTHLSRVAMLGELSGSIAHELNQPLAAILSNAQAALRFLAQGTGAFDEVRQILNDIVDQDKRAGELIRRLRILFKKGEIQLQPLSANDLVEDVLRLMRSELISRRVTASSDLAPLLPEVSGDPVQLQQVLLNLLINAADAAPDGMAEVHPLVIRTAQAESGDVCISVTDRGRGIPTADLQLVFEPFMTTKSQGMGLGLTVCRTIMHAHRGRIWAENNPTGGATFHFSLPTMRHVT
ncbi:MAG TPA: ATP-binding protein [Burkholderiales bacterium]|nr:ATP-binding protein [Burkholderiales bacterium]